MAFLRLNPRLAKIHRSYTVEEVARLFGVHKNSIRAWVKAGLPTIDRSRPTLIHGLELRRFLEARRQSAKRPCPPGHLFCVRCRSPKFPACGMADFIPMAGASGNLRGICPDCEGLIYRRVGAGQLEAFRSLLDIRFSEARARIGDSADASSDCDFVGRARVDADA